MSQKSPNPIDKHVGSRIRMRRLLIKMSQVKLAQAIGVTFQQVQKYENGTNRIGASRLHQIADVLGVPIEFFYEAAPGLEAKSRSSSSTHPDLPENLLFTTEHVQLLRAFSRIPNTTIRRHLIRLAESIASVRDDKAD